MHVECHIKLRRVLVDLVSHEISLRIYFPNIMALVMTYDDMKTWSYVFHRFCLVSLILRRL